ncbi:MAG: hypothetical protein F7C37_06125 [Desulfurococcales archaeon]|nr:hypothetical protein [Desulfurococcales archaeon]
MKLQAALIIIAAIAFSLGFSAGINTNNTTLNMADRGSFHVELYVYKNNQLMYHDPDDPAVQNLLAIFEAMLDNDNDDQDNIIQMNGQTFDLQSSTTYWKDFGRAVVLVSNSTAAFSRTMYSLGGNTLWAFGSAAFDGNNAVLVHGSIQVTADMNITWVGLAIHLYYDSDTAPGAHPNALLFADKLDSPIAVHNGDVVTIVYKIVVP